MIGRLPGASGLVFLWAFAGNGLSSPTCLLCVPPSFTARCSPLLLDEHGPVCSSLYSANTEGVPACLVPREGWVQGDREKKPRRVPGSAHVPADPAGGQAHVGGQGCKRRYRRAQGGHTEGVGREWPSWRHLGGREVKIQSSSLLVSQSANPWKLTVAGLRGPQAALSTVSA